MADTEEKGERKYKLSPETRARMSAAQQKRAKERRAGRIVVAATRKHRRKANADSNEVPQIDEGTFAYALGYIESWLGTYAAAAGVPASSLASRVGKVLHSKARG